jgi:uncharacterized protein (TIGR03000 family)
MYGSPQMYGDGTVPGGAPVTGGAVTPGGTTPDGGTKPGDAGKGTTPGGTPKPGGGTTPKDSEPPQASAEAPATILVNLPPNTRLLVDGRLTPGASSSRLLASPPIPRNRDFQYTLRAEADRQGQTMVQTQTVTVRAGQQSVVNFNFAPNGVVSNR